MLQCFACGYKKNIVVVPNDDCMLVPKNKGICSRCCLECDASDRCCIRGENWFKANKFFYQGNGRLMRR